MKSSGKTLILLLFSTALFYSGCKSEEEPKALESIQFELLKGTWILDHTTFEDTDRTTEFPGLELIISGTVTLGGTYFYEVNGTRPTPNPWPNSGLWKFGSNVKTELIRDPGAEDLGMTYSVRETQLVITFTCATCNYAGGRTNSINGEWEFTFNR